MIDDNSLDYITRYTQSWNISLKAQITNAIVPIDDIMSTDYKMEEFISVWKPCGASAV